MSKEKHHRTGKLNSTLYLYRTLIYNVFELKVLANANAEVMLANHPILSACKGSSL